ncbi:MAG TPA: serine hydrolase domain-containing protein [Blastocatellia bacterium]|nr:serine hydrolase domain-containing protein [Blastocatellia bacterium]
MKARNPVIALFTMLSVLSFAAWPGPPNTAAQKRSTLRIDAAELQSFVDSIFAEEMEKEHLPGAVFVLVKDRKVALSKGYGYANLEKKTPVKPDKTIFRIGSITKALTAMAVMQLADRGLIDIRADVNKYLADPKVPNRYGEPVRAWHLLSHTAGFDQIGRNRQVINPEARKSLGEFLDGQLIRIRPPGQVSCYDTYGITLAGHLVERVSGLSYSEYMKKHVFDPLGMTRTNVETPEPLKADLATGYGYREGKYLPQRYEYYVTTPASSIDSTALDMAQFMIAILGDGEAGKGRLFSARMARQIKRKQFSNHPDFPGFAHGFWEDFRNGQRAIHHGGAMLGFLTEMYLLPDHNLGFFVAYNRDEEAGGGPAPLRDILVSKLMDRWFPPAKEVTAKRTPLPIDTEPFAGTYSHNLYCHTCYEGEGWGRSIFPVKAAGKGILEMWNRRWMAVAPLVFEEENGSRRIAFRKDSAGRIVYMFSGHDAFERNGEWLLDEVLGEGWRKRPPEPLVAMVYRANQEWEKAAKAHEAIAARRPNDGRMHFYAGFCWVNAGEADRAIAALQKSMELRQWPSTTAYYLTTAYALKGDKDRALEWRGRAIELGFSDKSLLESDSKLDKLRDDPRFKALTEKRADK